ncbi:MAG: hypothetical protein P8Y14_13220 [Anaerolineales bacterium]|jgi:hypothetical protein
MDTREVSFFLDIEEGADRSEIAKEIQDHLANLQLVQEAAATPSETRLTGLEVIAGIALTVSIVKGTRELAVELNKLMPEIKKLIEGIKGVKAAFVSIDFEDVPLDEVDEEKTQKLAEELE